jgi:hypothetical protein
VGRIGPFEGFHAVRFYPALGAPRDDKKQRRINPATLSDWDRTSATGVACFALAIEAVTIFCQATFWHCMSLFVAARRVACVRERPDHRKSLPHTANTAHSTLGRREMSGGGVVVAGSSRQSEGPDDDVA